MPDIIDHIIDYMEQYIMYIYIIFIYDIDIFICHIWHILYFYLIINVFYTYTYLT